MDRDFWSMISPLYCSEPLYSSEKAWKQTVLNTTSYSFYIDDPRYKDYYKDFTAFKTRSDADIALDVI